MRKCDRQRAVQHPGGWARWLLMLVCMALLAACGAEAQRPPLNVVATIAPLGDWARQVGRERVNVTQIVPAGVDPETYQLTEQDRRALATADVVLCNGLGLEPWLAEILVTRDPQSFIGFRLSDFVGPLVQGKYGTAQPSQAQQADQGQQQGRESVSSRYMPDPVFSPLIWLDPSGGMAQAAVLFIADTFTRADPAYIRFYRGNAERYAGELENLDSWISRQVVQWPRTLYGSKRQTVLQFSDRSWYYFARRYGITMRTLVAGQSTAAASEQNTPLFVNRYMSPEEERRLRISRPPDGVLDPFVSDSYIKMMKHNVETMSQGILQASARARTVGGALENQPQSP